MKKKKLDGDGASTKIKIKSQSCGPGVKRKHMVP
jgi:hypothetical protein